MADDNTLSTVDNKGTSFGHQGEIAHEYSGFFDFAGILIYQTNLYIHGSGIGFIPFLALFNAIFRFTQAEVFKIKLQIAGKVFNRRNVMQDIYQALFEEPFIRFSLNVNQMRHGQYFFDSGITIPSSVTYLNRFKHVIPHPFVNS